MLSFRFAIDVIMLIHLSTIVITSLDEGMTKILADTTASDINNPRKIYTLILLSTLGQNLKYLYFDNHENTR